MRLSHLLCLVLALLLIPLSSLEMQTIHPTPTPGGMYLPTGRIRPVWTSVKFRRDGVGLGAMDNDDLWFWQLSGSFALWRRIENTFYYDFDWSPDASHIVGSPYGGSSYRLEIWNVNNEVLIRTIEANPEPTTALSFVTSIEWSPDGKRVATMGGELAIWDLESDINPRHLRRYDEQGIAIAWSPDSQFLASTGLNSKDAETSSSLEVWNAETGERIAYLGEGYKAVEWSPDGNSLISAIEEFRIGIWDTSTWEMIARTEQAGVGITTGLAWHPESKQFVSSNTDGNIYLWNAETGEQIAILSAHTDTVSSLSWSKDGSKIASGSSDGTIQIWTPEE
jgi:eukaryotic-like serine/threonine-protein kinase